MIASSILVRSLILTYLMVIDALDHCFHMLHILND